MAALMGIPHVVTDNNYGKISTIFQDYTGNFSTASWAETRGKAAELAKKL